MSRDYGSQFSDAFNQGYKRSNDRWEADRLDQERREKIAAQQEIQGLRRFNMDDSLGLAYDADTARFAEQDAARQSAREGQFDAQGVAEFDQAQQGPPRGLRTERPGSVQKAIPASERYAKIQSIYARYRGA